MPRAMIESELGKFQMSAITTVMSPLKRGRLLRPAGYIDLAFDAEYDDGLDVLISYQFSIFHGDAIQTRVYILNKVGGISAEEFVQLVLKFLVESGVQQQPHTVYLISHAAAAELRYIHDGIKRFRLREYHRGLGWEGEFGTEVLVDGELVAGEIKLRVIDLAGYYPQTRLATIGDNIGYPKVVLSESAPEHAEGYWKSHMVELLAKHPDLFQRYAKTDPEIVLIAWRQMLEFWGAKSLDPHLYRTIPSLAMADFRLHYLRDFPTPVQESPTVRQYPVKQVYRKRPQARWIFAGSHDMRFLAMRSYWGGYNVAFARGTLSGTKIARYYDVISLYVASAILQPLPNRDTRWLFGQDAIARWPELDGFMRARFVFPQNALYPNLPVMDERFPKLTFPLSGESFFTMAEARVALGMGATIIPSEVIGYIPTNNEANHVLKAYMTDLLKEKNVAVRGSLRYLDFKLQMVSVVGKFVYRTSEYDISVLQDMYMSGDIQISDLNKIYKNYQARKKLKQPVEVSSAWAPEWASLILGKARSIMAQIIACGCYHISTDGGLFPPEAIDKALRLPIVRELEAVGSGLVPEPDLIGPNGKEKNANPDGWIDEFSIVRTRMYGCWRDGKIVHHASHSVWLDNDEWDSVLRWGMGVRKPPIIVYHVNRLAKPKDVLWRGLARRLFDRLEETRSIGWHWDHKRAFDADADPAFGSLRYSRPHPTIKDAIEAEMGDRWLLRGGSQTNPEVDRLVAEKGLSRNAARARLWRKKHAVP